MTPKPPRRKLLRRPERRASIVSAAARAFARTGFAATSMDDVAAEAGVTKMIIYQHFASKHDLYRAVLEQAGRRLGEAAGPDAVGFGGLQALVTVARQAPEEFLLLFRHAAREPEFAQYAAELDEHMVGLSEGAMAASGADPVVARWMGRVAVRVAIESVIAWLEVGDPDRDAEFLERLRRMLHAALTAAGRTPRRSGRRKRAT